MKKLYSICLEGCDDSNVFTVELTQKQYELINKIGELSVESSEYKCQPTMGIMEVKK